MLSLLHIENIAVIECADITFAAGFNVMTGETGAGKSIVIDAISAILGERAYRDMIRTGADHASVRAVFSDVPQFPWFEEQGVDHDSEIIISRDIYVDGRNVCRVNGTLVSVSGLRKLGIQLINIHGQHDSASLFNEDNHLCILDEFSKNENIRMQYDLCYQQVLKLRHEIQRVSMDEGEKNRRMENLRYQIDEITKADLREGEDELLEERRKLLQNVEKLSDGLNVAVDSLYGNDYCTGAAEQLSDAVRELTRLSRYTDSYNSITERITDLMYQVQDVADELYDAREGLSFHPGELDEIESRLDVIHRLRKKYGNTCTDIISYLENAKRELDEIEFSDDYLEKLKKKLNLVEKEAIDQALMLRDSRRAGAITLTNRILSELSELDMPKVQFSCVFNEIPLSQNGCDSVSFYMSANAGEGLKPLNKVASGGELARIMLAMKNVLAEQDQVATLIFDEVDTGVSGRAAQRVAEKLKKVSENKQVLCVTHLPQLAAMADTHFLISKEEKAGRTYTKVCGLDRTGRKKELARIIGGANITETTLKSAEEMLTT